MRIKCVSLATLASGRLILTSSIAIYAFLEIVGRPPSSAVHHGREMT